MFERETRREKILEGMNKEMRLKNKSGGIINVLTNNKKTAGKEHNEKVEVIEDPIAKAEREFYEIIEKVMLIMKDSFDILDHTLGTKEARRSSHRASLRSV